MILKVLYTLINPNNVEAKTKGPPLDMLCISFWAMKPLDGPRQGSCCLFKGLCDTFCALFFCVYSPDHLLYLMIGWVSLYLICTWKMKFIHSFGKSELVEHTHINFWSKKWNPRRANLHMLGRHREYVCTFNEKCPLMVGMVYYDRPFMDHIERKKDQIYCWRIASKVNYDRLLVNYNRTFLEYIGRKQFFREYGEIWLTVGKLWSIFYKNCKIIISEKQL